MHPEPIETIFRTFNHAWPTLGLIGIGLLLALTVLMFRQLIEAGKAPRDPRDL